MGILSSPWIYGKILYTFKNESKWDYYFKKIESEKETSPHINEGVFADYVPASSLFAEFSACFLICRPHFCQQQTYVCFSFSYCLWGLSRTKAHWSLSLDQYLWKNLVGFPTPIGLHLQTCSFILTVPVKIQFYASMAVVEKETIGEGQRKWK